MEKTQVLQAVKELREKTQKKKFSQTFDLLINLKQYNIKTNPKISLAVQLPHGKGKKVKICGLIDKELETQAKKLLDFYILKDNFQAWNDKKKQKKLTKDYDFFIAQATVMTDIAKVFGKTFGPRSKMPDPKIGCVLQPTTNIEPLIQKLQTLVVLQTKNEAALKGAIATESMKDEEITENIMIIYDNLLKILPQGKENIKNIMLKMTMGPIYIIGTGLKNEKK